MKRMLMLLVLQGTLFAQTFSTLYNFHAFKGHPDGYAPCGVLLLQGTTLYGTTGAGSAGPGTVFSFDLNTGTETILHQFLQTETAHNPIGGVILDQTGNLLGTTLKSLGAGSSGAIYRLPITGGPLSVLFVFQGKASGPEASLVQVGTNYYSTAFMAGSNHPYGEIFRLNAKNVAATMWSFKNGPDGANPGYGTLIFDPAGVNAYGTTVHGGTGLGTVFSFNIKTKIETLLYSFTGPDGENPYGGLVMDSFGNLYGTTSGGGLYGYGTIFEISGGQFTTLYNFQGQPDGAMPFAGLTMDAFGNLYGTTEGGGATDQGTIFEWSQDAETILHNFNGLDGLVPVAAMTLGADGKTLYGSTEDGGKWGKGTIFSILP